MTFATAAGSPGFYVNIFATMLKGETETFTYDSRGKLMTATRGERKAAFRYDYCGRMTEKREDETVTTYAYDPWGQRTCRLTQNGALKLKEIRSYDHQERLTEIVSGYKTVRALMNDPAVKKQFEERLKQHAPLKTFNRSNGIE